MGRFPLPGGTNDALVNKKLLAVSLDVSATTIDTWLTQGLPAQTRGTNGSAYEFRLSVAYAWRQSREAAEVADRRFAEDAAAQLRLNLLGGSAALSIVLAVEKIDWSKPPSWAVIGPGNSFTVTQPATGQALEGEVATPTRAKKKRPARNVRKFDGWG